MSSSVWALLAAGGVLAVLVGLWRFIRGGFPAGVVRARDEHGERPPMALPQRRAWWGLAIGGVMTLALVGVVMARGATSLSGDRTARLLAEGIFALGVATYFTMLALTRRGEGPSGVVLDERDRAIMTRALSVSLIAGFMTLVAWSIVLTEYYWEEGAIPIDFQTFTLWTTFIVAVLGREAGILMGYAGWHGHGEG